MHNSLGTYLITRSVKHMALATHVLSACQAKPDRTYGFARLRATGAGDARDRHGNVTRKDALGALAHLLGAGSRYHPELGVVDHGLINPKNVMFDIACIAHDTPSKGDRRTWYGRNRGGDKSACA